MCSLCNRSGCFRWSFLPRWVSSFLDVLIFFTALFSATLILFSSSESLATSSDKYSSTVFHPPSDLSAIRINLFLFLRTANESSNNFTAFRTLFPPSSDSATLILPEISAFSSNYNWLPLNLKDGSVLFAKWTALSFKLFSISDNFWFIYVFSNENRFAFVTSSVDLVDCLELVLNESSSNNSLSDISTKISFFLTQR